MNRYFRVLLYIFTFSLFLLSCGLPTYNIAEAPVVRDQSAYSVSFSAPTEDNGIFGYEIYYKIYNSTDTSSIDSNRLEFDTDLSSYVFQSGDIKPNNLKFHRLNWGNNLNTTEINSFDLISVDALSSGEVVNISIGPGSGTDGNGRIYINGIEFIPFRNQLEGEYYKPFIDNVISADHDHNNVNSGDTYSVSFVAFSFVSSIITTYQSSYPVFLGTITDIPN